MKIRLRFFKESYSPVMDVPEETGTTFRMVLTKPLQVGIMKKGIPELRPLDTVCVFEWTGYS